MRILFKSYPSRLGGFRVSILSFFIALILSDPAMGWPRHQYSDPEVLQRAGTIVIAHVKEGSIIYVPHPIRDGAMSWEHHAVLIISEVIKGSYDRKELPIIIHYGLDPKVSRPKDDDHRSFSDKDINSYINPASTIEIYDTGGGGGQISGDIRKDQIWFLRKTARSKEYTGTDSIDAQGIWDPEDIQPLNLKPYFLAFLEDHPEEKLMEYANGNSPLAIRSQVYLDHLKIEEVKREPDLDKRAELLLPYFLFTDEAKAGPTQWEARGVLMLHCGQAGAARLVSIFKEPKYKAMQTEIMMVWGTAAYHKAVPILIDLVNTENRFWASQTMAEKDLWVNMRPGHSPNLTQIDSQNRISTAIFVFKELDDPRSKPILEETRKFWEELFPRDRSRIPRLCTEAIFAIETVESEKRRRIEE